MKTLLHRLKKAVGEGDGPGVPDSAPSYRVLFVCMGNICRSPTAAGVFAKRLREVAPELGVDIDSAGTHAYHVGEAPDARAQRAAERRGVDLGAQRARRVLAEDFDRFDLILAMDELNRAVLVDLCPPERRERIRLFLEFAPHLGRSDVPDPYYGGGKGFEYVLDLVEEASGGLIEHLRVEIASRRGPSSG
jgi:protein-tyrosine phosphatase